MIEIMCDYMLSPSSGKLPIATLKNKKQNKKVAEITIF